MASIPRPVQPASSRLSLDEVLERVRAHPSVCTAALVGSSTEGLRAGSDIDLLVVLEGPSPRLWITPNYIDSVPADIICTTKQTVELFITAPDSLPFSIREWLRGLLARIPFENALLASAGQAAARMPEQQDCDLSWWYALNAEAITLRRLEGSRHSVHADELLASRVPALDLLWSSYLGLRGWSHLPRKRQIQRLIAEDSAWWSRYQAGLSVEPASFVASWLQLADEAAEPCGGLWPAGTVFEPVGEDMLADSQPPPLSALL